MDCKCEDLKRYVSIIAVGGIRWSNANCCISVHSCVWGVCVSFILYRCWLVFISRYKPSGMFHRVSGSVFPSISEALRSFLSTGTYLPSSTASHPRWLECAAALLCESQILCHFGLLVVALLVLTFCTPEYVWGTVRKVWYAFKYRGWWCHVFSTYDIHPVFLSTSS